MMKTFLSIYNNNDENISLNLFIVKINKVNIKHVVE